MLSLPEQFKNIMDKAYSNESMQGVASEVANAMDTIKNDKTLGGESPAGDDKWYQPYSEDYATRKRKSTTPVTLRDELRRIESTFNEVQQYGVDMVFTDSDFSRIAKWHNDGSARGGKIRQIYPENYNELPQEIKALIPTLIKRALRGANAQ